MIVNPIIYFSTIIGFLALLMRIKKFKSSLFTEIENAKKKYINEATELIKEDSNIEELSVWCRSIIWLSRTKVLFGKGIQASILLIVVSFAGLCVGENNFDFFPLKDMIYILWLGILICVVVFFVPAIWWSLKIEE